MLAINKLTTQSQTDQYMILIKLTKSGIESTLKLGLYRKSGWGACDCH